MNFSKYLLLFLLVIGCHASAATPSTLLNRAEPALAQRAFNQYVERSSTTKPSSTPKDTLVTARVYGLPPTEQNARQLAQSLSKKVPDEERIDLIRLLGSMYQQGMRNQVNVTIASELRREIENTNPTTAKVALQNYSRCGYQPDRGSMLDLGLRRGLITQDEMAQELALGLLAAPADAQIDDASRLVQLDRVFGVDVLTQVLTTNEAVKRLTPAARQSISQLLLRREPVMPTAIGEYGYNDGGRYSDWLNTLALLEEADGGNSYFDVVERRLNDVKTDPRKLLGFLTSPYARPLLANKTQAQKLRGAAMRAVDSGRQFPSHAVLAQTSRYVAVTFAAAGVALTDE